jgi:hypothetical protein
VNIQALSPQKAFDAPMGEPNSLLAAKNTRREKKPSAAIRVHARAGSTAGKTIRSRDKESPERRSSLIVNNRSDPIGFMLPAACRLLGFDQIMP